MFVIMSGAFVQCIDLHLSRTIRFNSVQLEDNCLLIADPATPAFCPLLEKYSMRSEEYESQLTLSRISFTSNIALINQWHEDISVLLSVFTI